METWRRMCGRVLLSWCLCVVSWWRHQMETLSALLAICVGIHRSPHKGQWRGALMFSLICVWVNDWVNNREAGDLRRHRGHYDVIVMAVSEDSAAIIEWASILLVILVYMPMYTTQLSNHNCNRISSGLTTWPCISTHFLELFQMTWSAYLI